MADASPDKWLDEEQMAFIEKVKQEIRTAQHHAMRQVNQDMILLYWKIGRMLNDHVAYGNQFIERLARELRSSFPSLKGFSVRNLRYMQRFAREIPDERILQTVSAELSWSHNVLLLDKLKEKKQRLWYAQEAIKNGWSVRILEHQVEWGLYQRQVEASKITNFDKLLPPQQSELATQMMKDPYIFDFISMRDGMLERDFEDALVHNVTKMLLELGQGFAFLGHQYHIVVGGEDFYIDLLFYNVKLHCYFVIELKTGEFQPEYAGKLNFYLSAVDSQMRGEGDAPTIGLILCKGKNDVVAEYSLRDMTKPMGVSAYQLTRELPDVLKDALPSKQDFDRLVDMNVKKQGEHME